MQALIATIPHNAWLTGIDITDAGEHVVLIGKAYDSHTVLSFVDNLNRNELFSELGLRFRLLKVKRAVVDEGDKADGAPVYDFHVTTSEDDEKAK